MMLYYEMWFESPSGLVFKITVSVKDGTSAEVLELARANWDFNVAQGYRPVSTRP